MVAGQDRLDQEERGEGHRLADGERDHGGDGRLGGQHCQAPRHCREGGADQPGGMLGAEREDAQQAGGERAMQTGFPPAKLLLILTAYALVFGSLAVRYFRWE